ncbi:MAG: alanine racemase [Anaerolineae bacterium]
MEPIAASTPTQVRPHPDRPTWVEIDRAALAQNVRTLAKLAHPAGLMAVVKANAYGHGAVAVAQTALAHGASWLGVATLSEALTLRRAGITAPILVLGYLPGWQAEQAIAHNIRATIFNRAVLQDFSRAAQHLNQTARLHLKIDTGMGRLGLLPPDVLPFVQAAGLPGVELEGIFTHFGRADEADLQPARAQLRRFQTVLNDLSAHNLCPPVIHAANTAAALTLPEARFTLVRAGIGLYGLAPSPDAPLPPEMRPALHFKTTIAQVKTLPPDSPIGYGATYRTRGHETIAIIPVGYADGFRRAPANWGSVLVRGRRAPLVGRVSMDQSAINVSYIPGVRQGDEVVLIGQQGKRRISVEEVAARLGTINYEVVSQILARVPRLN